jgi:hypothetical protein
MGGLERILVAIITLLVSVHYVTAGTTRNYEFNVLRVDLFVSF